MVLRGLAALQPGQVVSSAPARYRKHSSTCNQLDLSSQERTMNVEGATEDSAMLDRNNIFSNSLKAGTQEIF